MNDLTLGIKAEIESPSAKCIKVIRNILGLPISEIKNRLMNHDYIYAEDSAEDETVNTVISLYEKLKEIGVKCTVYEYGMPSKISILYNLRETYAEIDKEVEENSDLEIVEHENCFVGIRVGAVTNSKIYEIISKITEKSTVQVERLIDENEYVYTCPSTDSKGTSTAIRLYEALESAGAEPHIFENDHEDEMEYSLSYLEGLNLMYR